jgi:hypothetical protein
VANSRTLCQKFVTQALAFIIHCTDDILLTSSEQNQLHIIFDNSHHSLVAFGLCIATKKAQKQALYLYLRTIIDGSWIKPTLSQPKFDNLKTLSDFKKLLSDVNWIHPTLKLIAGALKPLFDILKADSDPPLHGY